MEDKRDILYKNLLGSGRVSENEIGTLDQFKSAIKDEGTARQFHKNLLGAGFTSDEIGSDDDFYNSISSDFDPKHDTVMAHSVNPNWEQGVVPAVAASKTENKPAITSVDNKTAAPVHQEVFGQSINPEWNQHILSPYTGKKEVEDFSDKPTFQTYDNVRDYYAGKFSMTEEGKAAQGEIAEIEKDLVDTMIGRMKQSDEYKAIIASDAAPGDKDKTLQAIWERDYQPEVDKFMQPFINEYGEKILNRYGQSMQGDYHQLDKDNASASWEGINNRIEQVEAELDKTNGGWKNVGRPTFESAVSKNERETASQVRNEKVRQISAARSMMERSQKMIQAANDNKDGTFLGGLARGFRDETFNLDNWTFGVKGMRDGKACIDVMEKYERGEKLTKEEEILMDALASEAATQAYFSSDLGRGYKAGAVTGASLPFMLDMMTGMGLVSGATKAASKGLMKWIAKKGLQAGAKKTLTKGGLGLAKGITDSAIHTATFGSARVGENYLDRANGNAKFDIDNEGYVHYAGREGMETGAGALGKAFASTALETQSELIGAQFGPALNFVGKQMMRIPGIRNIPASKIGKLAKEYSGSAAGKMLKDFTSKTQFHGMLGEYAEEVYNNIGSTLLGDMTPEQLVSLDQNLDTFLGVSVMSAAFGTIGTGAFIRERYKNRKAMRDFEKVMRDNMDYDAIKESLKDADIEGAKTFIKEVMSDKSLSPEERKEEIEYIVDVLKESVMGSAEQEIGKEPLSEEEIEANKAAIVTEFEQARKNLESAVPPEILSMVDAGQDISSMPMSEEQEMTVADYIAAKSGMDDYMNSVDNKVTEAKMEARREVEGVSNPDMGAVVRVTRRGSDVPINIVGGKITFDEEGLIDKENSDDIIYYVDENGKRKQGTPGDFEKLVDSTDTEAVAQQAEADAEQQVLDEEQAQLPQPYMPQPGEEVVLPNGYRGTVAGMQDSETVIVSNGESTVAARLDEVQPANQAQPVIESPVSSTQQAQPVEEKAESVTDSAQEPEQPAEETKPTAMPMIGEGENMEPDFKSVDPQRTYDYLYGEEGGLTPEEASAFVDANIAEKQKAVEKFSSKAPKMGTSLVKYRKAQAEWKAQAEAAQKELDYWNSVKSKRDEVKAAEAEEARKVKAGEEVASVVREMGEPMNGEELAATMLANGAINLRRDEFTKETGYGNAEASKLFGLFRTKDNGGVSLQEAGELVMQADREAGTNFFDQNDPNAGRNAILDVLASSTTPSDLRNFIKNNREAQAKKEEQAERDYFDSVIQSSFHMSLEEFELYQERLMANNPFEGVDLKELDAIFAEDYINRLNVEQNGQGNIEPIAGSQEVLPGTQAGDTGTVATGNEERQAGRNGEAYVGHAPTLEGTAGTGTQETTGRETQLNPASQTNIESRGITGRNHVSPLEMSDEEKNSRGELLRNAVAYNVDTNVIVSTPSVSARKAAEIWWDEHVPRPLVYGTEAGEVEINRNSIEGSLAHGYGQMKLDAITSLEKGFENSVYLGTLPDSRERGVVDHYFAYPINYNGKRCYVFCRALNDANKNRLYVHEVFLEDKIKKGNTLQTAASKPHGGIALYRDILANVLGQAKDKHPSSLSTDKNDIVWPEPTVGSTASTDNAEVVDSPTEVAEGETVNRGGNSSQPISFVSKDSNNDSKKQEPKAITTNIQGGILDIATAIAKEQDRQDVRDQVNTEPSEAQKEAGNYKMGHLKVDGLDVSLENPKGSTRSGKDANGTEWSVTMNNDYGYIRRTEGADGDHVDVFLSDNPEQGDVFVVDQVKADGSFDEHKVMYGFNSEEEARAAYLANYSPGWKGLGAITRASKEEFKEWVKDGEKKSVPFSGNKSLLNSLYNEGESLSLQGKEGAYEQGKVDGISGEGSGIDNSDAATEILRQTGRRTAAKNGQTGRKKESILGELAEKTSGSPYWINDVQSMVSSPIGKGGENEVYLSSDGSHVIKVNDFSYLPNDSTNFDSFLNRVEAHNELFPNDAISVIGFTNNSEGRTSVVLMQPYVHAVREAKQEEIDNFLEEMDFYTDMSGDWTDGRFDIADTRPENVLVDANGLLHFVDVLPFDSKRNGKMLEIPKKREAFTEKKSVPFATLVDEELEKQLGKPKKAFFNLKPTSDEEKKQRKDAERRARIDELFKKEKEAFANEDGHNSYAEGLRESKTWQEAVSFFRKKKSELEAEAKDWSGRKYKKNGGSVLVRSDEDMDGWEEKSVDGINERRRRNAIHAALKRAQEFEEFAQTLMSRIGASETQGDEKGDETKSSEAYSITPAQYTTKKGKVLDMQLVTPASQLDKEQVKQATKFAKDKRGWYDFAKGGFMMRSEEDAKEMASFIEEMNAPEKKENIKTPENQTYNEPEDTETLEETEPEVQASQLSTWKADATPINTDGSYDIILNGEQEYITITKDFGNGVYVADAVNSRGEKHQFIGITEEQIRKGIALMLDKDASSEKSPKDEPEKPVEKKRWKYSLHVDKTSGYTTIERDDVSGVIPITDGNWKIKAESPEEMLEILRNPKNNVQELLDEFSVTLKNKISFRKIAEEEKKAKEAKPAESLYGSNNKMVTNEQYEALKARMKKKLNQLNMGMDPEMIEIGTMMAVYHFEAGARKFADYAKHMIDDCGDGIRPYLKSFYNAIRDYPGINDVEMTPYDEVRTFDVANFDKTGTDVIALAEQIANEQEVEKKVEKVKKTSKTGKKKKQDSSIGDLFGSQEAAEQTDNTISETQKEENNGQEVQLQTGSSTSEREGRHQPGQNEPVGKSEQHEAEGPDGRRMGGRDSVYPVSDTQRSGSVSGPLKSKSSVEVKPKNTRNNVSERGHDYAPKSDKARVDANIKALEIMNRLIESGQPATREDMEALRQFSGWGGLGGAFKERIGNQWSAENPINKKLRELLTPEQYEWASGSASASQYFTPAFTIDAMWDIARSMGFKGGNVLEGSAGIGNILGLMPRDLSEKSNLIAVEKDEAVGQMLSLLYPDAKVEIKGFEEAKIENGSVDLAITNVPFVTGLKVFDTSGDTDLSRMFRDIHNFCIAKNIRKLRQGGIGIFISSSGTMDKSPKLMNWIISEGNSDVVGAFRLNSNTFGGTNATSDIIVVRKRVNGKKSSNAIDVSKSGVLRVVPYVPAGSRSNTKPKDMALDMNQYYIEHPENLGGEMAFAFEKGETYQETSKRLYPSAEVNQEKRLASWVDSFKDMNWEASAQREDTRQDTSVIYEDLGEDVKEGSMLLDSNGELCLAQRGKAVPIGVNKNKVKGKTKAECFKDYKAIKDALSAVLEYQITHESDKGLAPLLKELNRAYDDFVNTYGHLNKNVSISFLKADMDFPSIAALENVSEKGRKDGKRDVVYSKTDVFKKRVVDKESEPEPQNVKDGIIASIYLHGRVDVPYIAEQLGKTKEEVRSEIVKSGLGFENPTTTDIDVSYEYLSGNVREKLKIAKDANTDGRYDANVKALEAVVPMNIPAHLVQFSLGSSWVDPKLYTDYVLEKTEVKVGLTNAGGTWVMSKPHYVDYEKNKAMGVRSEICNKIVLGHELIEAAMQNRTISVTRTIKHYNGETETIVDKDATMACSNKIDEIRQNFKEWARKKMQSDPELSQEIERIYNDQFNNYVPKEISNEFIPEHFGGAASTINGVPFNLRKHQAKAAIRATTQPLMLAHEVGTGKTFTLITTAMEMRRLGTARKPMIVVQNATVGQFVGSAKSLYPNARILTLEDADRTSEGRKNFYAKIRYNDWDMIVVPQSVFERIPDSPEREARFVQDKIEEKMRVIEQLREAADNDRDPAVRRAEKELESLQDELNEIHLKLSSSKSVDVKDSKDKKREAKAKQNAAVKAQEMLDRETDDTMDFDDMGIDALLIDEAHEYKHLGFETAMQRGVKGVDPSYSKKSQGVYLKTQAVLENNKGRNVVFATGTPISNTAAEIWTFMRYLMPADVMKSYDIFYFDDFVRNFGQIEQIPEFGASGKYKEVNRFNGYTNLPELERIWLGVADTVLTKQAGGVSDKIPAMEGDKAQDVYLPQTKSLRSVMKYVKERLNAFENMTGKEKRENSHIPLVMYGIAKAAAVDTRLVLNDAPDETNSKTNETVRQTLKSLKETKSYNGTVAIFADNYQNKKNGFNLYEDIRAKLIKQGVPDKQIIIMRSGMSVKKKLEIFDQVNRGEVRVIMGSTVTLGTGVNIQERLHTLIHVDAPVRPMDYTQRNGRILRQGNLHKEWDIPVRVLRFGVEDSLDVTAYQRLKTKGAIADSIMNGQKLIEDSMNNRVLEEEQDIFGDITAQLSGSEYALLKNQAEKQLKKLESRYSQWEQDQMYIHNEKPRLKGLMNEARRRKEEAESALSKVEAIKDKTIHIGKQQFVNVDAMADFIKDYNIKQREAQEKVRTSSGDKVVSRLPVVIGGYEFVIDSETSREIKHTSSGMVTSASTKMRYSCKELGLDGLAVDGQKIKNAINDILDDIISGNDFREIIDVSDAAIKRHENGLKQLETREGKPFEEAEALEQAKAKVEEYEELMKKELEEKEAKYAEIDKEVEAASGVEGVEEDEDSDEGLRFREDDEEESDKKTPFTDQPNRANEKPVSGSVPASIHRDSSSNPMASKQADAKIDKDTQSTKSKLRKFFNGDYHVDSSSLNKTFVDLGKMLSMQDKGGSRYSVLRTNAGDTVAIRLSDHLANGNNFKRDNADSNLSIVIERHVYGTQGESDIEYTEAVIKQETFNQKPEEVIKAIVNGVNNVLEGKEFSLDPSIGEVRSEMSLLNREGEGTYTDKELSYLNDPISIFMGKNRFPKKRQESYAGKVRVRMKERAKGLAELLNLDNVEILEDTEGLKGRKARAKGWFDPNTGKIVVVVPNHKSTYDIQQTVLHEAVAHYGLRKLFGKHFNDFLDNVYNNASAEIRGRIAQRAVEKKWDIREATEEYLADLAEHTNFENAQSEGWFQQIKNFFIRMLAKAGIRLDAELTDNELRYILWRSFDNLTNPGGRRSIIDEAKDIATQYELGVGNYEGSESSRYRVAKTLFRDGEDGSIRAYEESLKGVRYKFQEAYQDSMLALKHLQEVVAKTSGKPIQAFEDAYMAENHLSSKNTAEARKYYEAYFEPLEKEIAKITKGDTKGYEELSDYLILKHGVERNIEYSMRAFFRGLEGKMEEEEIEQYYSDYQSAKNALRKNVEDGTISEADYIQELEAIALEYVDTIDDYSGTRALLGRMAEAKMPNGVAEKDKTVHYLNQFNSVYGEDANMQELARKAIAEYEGTHNVSSLWEKVNKATKYGLRKAYDSGMMSRDSYHHVDGMFRYYVPLRGWDEKTADDVYEYLGSEISPVNSVLKTAKGRKSIPDNPLPVIGNMAESAIIQGNRNMMKQSFLNMVQNHPTDVATLKKAWYVLDEVTGEWYVSYPDIEAHDTADDIADKVRDHELRMEELESKGLATQKRGKLNINYRINKGQAKEHVVNVKRNGQDYVIYVNGNPRAAQAVNGMTNPDAVTSKTLQAWNAANRWLAANFTTRNPAFVLSNISRDLIFAQSAVMVKESPEYAGKFFVNAGKAMSVVMRNINGKGSESNEMDRYFREFVENGGETGYMHLTDVDQYRKKIKRDLERLSGKEVKAKAAARYCIDRLDDFNRWAEDVSRFAAYATSRQMGRSIQESVRDAKEVTVNFNKKGAGFKTGGFIGSFAGVMRGVYLFFNVGIQSLVNFGRLAMKNPGKMGAMLGSFAATGVLVPAVINPMLYALLGGAGDDDPYKNLSEWERRNNLCIYCGGGGFIKVPLPIELRAFYGLGEMSYDYMTRKTRVRPEEAAFALANQITELLPLNPLGNNGDILATIMPDALQPFYEVSENKDYAGRPVYNETPFNELDPEFKRTYKGTSGWLVDVSQYLNEATRGNDFKKGEVDFNPAKIEHIYEYYLGGMGKTINQLGKTLWYGAKSIANGEKDENLVLRNVPVVNRFLSFPDEKNANAGINKEYFRMVDEWETLDHELNELAKKGALMNPKYLQQYIDLTNSDQYKWYKAFESFKKSLDGLYQMRKAIPDEEMQKQVDEQMMVLKRQAIDEMEKFSK